MKDITRNVVVPTATEDDARETAKLVRDYEFGEVTAVHVIEHVKNAPDPISPEQAEERAQTVLAAFREVLPEANVERVFQENVVQGILEVASEMEASAIVFRPRGGSRIVQLLSGDVALRLVTKANRPVIALPEHDDG